jgi:hypothetical protein
MEVGTSFSLLSSLVGIPCYYGNGKAGPRDHISSIMAGGGFVVQSDNGETPCWGREKRISSCAMYGGIAEKGGEGTPLQNPTDSSIFRLKPLDPQINFNGRSYEGPVSEVMLL